MIDRDIWITANEMIEPYDDEAVTCRPASDVLQDLNDVLGYAVWKRVVAAINELRSAELNGKRN